MSHFRPHFALFVLLMASLACGGGGAAALTEAPTADGPATAQAATQMAQGVETAQAESQAAEAATQAAQLAHATATAEAEIAEAATGTAIFAQTATPARATEVAANKKATKTAATAQAIVAATEQAAAMEQVVQQLVTDGHLSRSAGTYYAIPEFYDSWAYLNYYNWLPTDLSPTDFVIRADTSWESASNTADWYSSGCGFVFREESPDNHYLIFLGLDGYVHLSDFRGGVFHMLGEEFYGTVNTPKGGAQVMLVVEGRLFKYFVNGERVLTRESASMPEGRLNLTLVSGTNKDFGTRCLMKNIEVWELK